MSWLPAPVLLVATAVVALLLGPLERSCAAEPAGALYVSLDYEVEGAAGGRCWDEPAFRRTVAQSIGYDPFRTRTPLGVFVRVDASATLVEGRVEWRNADGASLGERRFRAKDGDCAALLTDMSFAVGLQIELLRPKRQKDSRDATGELEPGGPTSSPSTSTTAPTSPSSAPPTTPSQPSQTPASERAPASSAKEDETAAQDRSERASSASPEDFSLWLGLGPSLAFGAAPSVTVHGRLFAGARRGDLSLELGAEGTLEVTEHEPDGSGFAQHLLGGSVTVCGHVRFLVGCAIGKLAELRVSGLDVDAPRSPTARVVQAGLRVGAPWEASEVWFLTPHLDALALLTPRAVELNEVTVWDMPALSVLAGIDVGGRFR